MFKTVQPGRHARAYPHLLPRKARPDLALERDNPAERLARIDKLMAENKSTPAAQEVARLQASLMVVSLPKAQRSR